MYIEAIHDAQGNIVTCLCADSLPVNSETPFFKRLEGIPAGHEQSRINIDTLTAMEIDGAAGQKAVIDPITNQPKIVTVDRGEYVMKTFKVDMAQTVTTPAGVTLPAGMKMRGLVRRV